MGCDIHMYAEKYNSKNNLWEKVGNEFISSYGTFMATLSIEKNVGVESDMACELLDKYVNEGYDKDFIPTNTIEKLEKYVFNYLDENLPPRYSKVNWEDALNENKLPNLYTCTPYDGRNYELFGILAGVRSNGFDPIDYPRDLPDDVSEEIRDEHMDWGSDAHSASYYYLSELLESGYRKLDVETLKEYGISHFFKDVLDRCVQIADDPKDFRLVFWFDS